MKILLRMVIVIVILLAVLVLARNAIIERVVRKNVLQTTGFDIELGGIRAGVIESVFEIVNARLINPEDFAEATALEIKTIRVGYDLSTLFKEEVRLREVLVDVSRAVLVIREDGETNLGRLGRLATQESEKTDEPASAEDKARKEKKPAKRLRVDSLTLRLAKVEVHQYREGLDNPEISKYDVHFDRTARDVTNLDVVNGMITAGVIEAVGARALQGMTKIFKQNEGDLDKVGKQIERTAKDVGRQLQGLLKEAGAEADR